ncbi:hypothetical protein ON010_g3251 [Phytophthora cinnamomi]|nr:hypothetical protein ON010_g3251 [Phytophthora cinnamomi]
MNIGEIGVLVFMTDEILDWSSRSPRLAKMEGRQEKPASSVGARAPSVEDADSAVASSSSDDVLSADESSDWSGSSPIASVVDDGDYESF